MKKLTVIVKPSRKEETIEIFESCAVYGLMVEDIKGYGNQRGDFTNYRGLIQSVTCLTKVKIETIADEETIEVLVSFLKEKLRTGKIGDGKIFIENVEDAVRIRTGERGEMAL